MSRYNKNKSDTITILHLDNMNALHKDSTDRYNMSSDRMDSCRIDKDNDSDSDDTDSDSKDSDNTYSYR